MEKNNENRIAPGIPPQSVWSVCAEKRTSRRQALSGDKNTQVLVVGAGISGILLAWRLREAGIPCIVAEAEAVGCGVTRNTTAKITAQHGLIYADLIKRFGTVQARNYFDANTRAIEAYRELDRKFPCDFEARTAYVYSVKDPQVLEREAKACQSLGIEASLKEPRGLPIQTAGAIAMENQAQFNPMKLIMQLSENLEIYEDTFVREIRNGRAVTDKGTITARHIVLATHFPMVNIPGLYFIKLYQHRSYVIALEGAAPPEGMYVDERPDGLSFRTYGNLLLVGGGDHKTGKRGGGFSELQNFAACAYPGAEIKYRWATQDCMSLDAVPYIGRHRSGESRLYVATGFNKWGMTGSMVASELLCELISNGKSELEGLYLPKRSILTKQLAANTASAASGLLSPGGHRCTHMGCKLKKNEEEGTWDCPCHGSRFDAEGHLINNPAKRGLEL